ncbi:MAG: sigma-70 family RNA polymerase sigma factor [Pseudomonadota bacterium]
MSEKLEKYASIEPPGEPGRKYCERPEGTLTRWLQDYRAVIYRVVMVYAFDTGTQEDLFQEIAAALWRSIPKFAGKSKESTWIYRVALNTAIDQLRAEKRRPKTQSYEDSDHWVDLEEPDESITILYAGMRTLTGVDRSLLLLYLDGNSYAEIGEILGISTNSVGVKLLRAKEKLKTALSSTTTVHSPENH